MFCASTPAICNMIRMRYLCHSSELAGTCYGISSIYCTYLIPAYYTVQYMDIQLYKYKCKYIKLQYIIDTVLVYYYTVQLSHVWLTSH